MTKARIYQPDKNAMQSGLGNTQGWLLELRPESPYFSDPLMGWTGMQGTDREIRLSFPTQDEAVAYAKREGIAYEVEKPHLRRQSRKAYADNFKFNRIG